MVKILKCLLILHLLIWSNAYAWYCTYTPTDEGYITEGSTQCYGIDVDTAIETVWCTAYQPDDPICQGYYTCVDQTEQRSIACSEPNTSGIVNQARYYTCSSESWSSWVDTTYHCIPDPPTCLESVEERTVNCEPGYHGSSVEQRITTCSTPYSDPIPSSWLLLSTTCTLKATDPTSIESPLNPVSPINTTVQPSTPVPSTAIEPVTVDQDPVQMETAMPPEIVKPELSTEKQEPSSEPQSPKTKENEEIVPGFGVVLMMNTLETLNNIYEQPVDNFIGLYQDDYAAEQNILFNFIQSDDIGDRFNSIANHRWDQLHGDHPLQRYGFGD